MSVKKSFSIFVIIVVLSIVGVLFCSIDASTFAMLGDANPALLACAAALVVLMWFLDAFKFMTLARAAGEKLSLRCTLSVVWINYFGSAITPMQSGGGPFQVYLLYRNGVSVGKSVAITLVRTLPGAVPLGACNAIFNGRRARPSAKILLPSLGTRATSCSSSAAVPSCS